MRATSIIKTAYGCVARFQVGRRQRVFRACIEPLETVVSTVGSGDAFLAGFVSARFQKLDLTECLRQGLAAGAANTQRYGAGMLDPDTFAALLDTTEVVEVAARPRLRLTGAVHVPAPPRRACRAVRPSCLKRRAKTCRQTP